MFRKFLSLITVVELLHAGLSLSPSHALAAKPDDDNYRSPTPGFNSAVRAYVQNEKDLTQHFKLHIQRVTALAMELYDSPPNPELFAGISRQLALDFLSLHDQAKINDSEEFRRKYWVEQVDKNGKRLESFITRLMENYGTDKRSLSDELRAEAEHTIRTLNLADDNVANGFFKAHGLLDEQGKRTEIAERLKILEKIADCVDRNTDPVAREELSLPTTKPPKLDRFLSEPYLTYALKLKEKYAKVVKGLTYYEHYGYRCPFYLSPDYTPLELSAPHQSVD